MPTRALFLALLAMVAMSASAMACMDDVEELGQFQPTLLDGQVFGNPIGTLHVQSRAVMTLGLLAKGDHWELPPGGEDEHVAWDAQMVVGGGDGPGFVRLSLWGKAQGLSMIPLRYVHANAKSHGINLMSLRVLPTPPPPPPPTLTVTGADFNGGVPYGRSFVIRLTAPLPPGTRWEVKEAVYRDADDGNGMPIEITAQNGEPGTFTAVSRGRIAHIVFVQKRAGWQLFPETVTINLIVEPVPKC